MSPFFARRSVARVTLVVVTCGVLLTAQVCQADLIGYWQLEGTSGSTVGTVADSSTNGLTGTASGSPVYSADVPGVEILDRLGGESLGADTSSVQFSGGNYVDIPYNAILEPSAFTIEFFMKAGAQAQYPGIVQKPKSHATGSTAVGQSNVTWGIGKASADQEFARVDPANGTSNKTFTIPGTTADGTWHHFAMTYNGAGTWTIYEDYTKTATITGWTVDYDGLSGLRFARAATDFTQQYNGLLDAVRFSDTVLTADQFLTLAPMTLQWGVGGAGGSGTWDATTTANWYPGSGSANLTWSVAATRTPSEAVFGGAAGGGVSIATGGVTAKSVTFNTAGYIVSGPGKLTLTTPSVVANQDATISASIAPPAAGLDKSGAATLTLSGPNLNYVQPTTVSAGVLRLADTTNFASPVTLSGGNLELAGSTDWSLDAPVSGTGSVVKTGANQVTLQNTSSYEGQTIVAGGTLRLGAAAVPTSGLAAWYDAGVGVTTSGSTVTAWADRTGQHNATAIGSPTLVAGEINGQPAVDVTTGSYLRVDGDPFQVGSVYTVFESPTATFTYYGTPFGAVNYQPPASPPGNTNGGRPFLFESGKTNFWQDVYPVDAPRKNGDPLVLGTKYDMGTITDPMVLGVDVAFPGRYRNYYIGRGDSYTASLNIAEILAYDHVLTSAEENLLGAYLAQKYGIGTSYVGQAQDSIPNGSTVAIAAGATFDLNGASETIGALADYLGGDGVVTNNAAGRPSVLTLAASSGSSAFSGTIRDGAGPISLVKNGGGTQVLSGANTYSGTTAVGEGTLQLIGGPNRLPGTTALTLGDAVANTGGKLVLGDAGGAVSQTIAPGSLAPAPAPSRSWAAAAASPR